MKPVVYGNVARYFGKKREEDGHTHQWTVYVKPYRNEVGPERVGRRSRSAGAVSAAPGCAVGHSELLS